MAAAILLFDYDCLGYKGDNMGYIEDEDICRVFKIDAGGSFPINTEISHDVK